MKKIIATLKTKNEKDIIESFCRYNLTYCDELIIYERGSSDNTNRIIKKLIEEGLPIYLYDDPAVVLPPFEKGNVNDDMAYKAINEYGADLVIPLDTDEFIYHIDGENPRKALEALCENVEYQMLWRTYVYEREPDISLGFFPNNFTYYRNPEMENNKLYERHKKVVLSKYLMQEKHAKFARGTHFLVIPEEYRHQVKIEIHDKIVFAHFPVRSKAQIMKKGILNWLYLWGNKRRPHYMHRDIFDLYQIGVLFNKIKEHGELDFSQIKNISLEYAMLIDYNTNDEYNLFTEAELDKIKNDLGDNLLIEGPMDVSFCDDKIELKYTDYDENNEKFIQNILKELDSTVTILATENDKMTKTINEKEDEIKRLTQELYVSKFLFPFNKIQKNSKIILYGGGIIGQKYLKQIKHLDYCHCLFVADKNYKQIREICGVKVCNPEEILNYTYDNIVIASENYINEIRNKLCELKVPDEKIVGNFNFNSEIIT